MMNMKKTVMMSLVTISVLMFSIFTPVISGDEEDNEPPVTTKEYGTPFYTDGVNDWITSNTHIWLNATDYPLGDNCGVSHTLYRILKWDGTGWVVEVDWSIYHCFLTIPSECRHKIEFYSVDNCCNQECVKWQEVYVDNTPPCSNLTIENDPDGYVFPYSTFWITAMDCGVCKVGSYTIYYKINEEQYQGEPNTPVGFQLYGRPSGLYDIEYWAVDDLGNEETHHSGIYYLDSDPPHTVLSFSGPHQYKENHWQITPETQIMLIADDGDGIGVEKTLYSTTGTGGYVRYVEPFMITKLGEHELVYYSFDLFGQMENPHQCVIEVMERLNNSVPDEPSAPAGPSSGEPGVQYTYSVQTSDPDNDRIRYYFDWGDGTGKWSDFVLSGQVVSMFHEWDTNDCYSVRVKAQDVFGGESGWSPVTEVRISTSPNTPSKPSGQASVKKGKAYNYYTLSVDPDGDRIRYGWDWDGDKTVDQWTGFYDSGERVEVSHVWYQNGVYSIRVKAQDENGVESGWSDPLSVSIFKNRVLPGYSIFMKLFARFVDIYFLFFSLYSHVFFIGE